MTTTLLMVHQQHQPPLFKLYLYSQHTETREQASQEKKKKYPSGANYTSTVSERHYGVGSTRHSERHPAVPEKTVGKAARMASVRTSEKLSVLHGAGVLRTLCNGRP